MSKTMKRLAVGTAVMAGVIVLGAVPGAAHPHTANGHPIADGQLHPKFLSDGTSCESYGTPNGAPVGPAWYGLEVAHHGPDTGDPGKGDGCYRTEVKPNPNGPGFVPAHDTNPAID